LAQLGAAVYGLSADKTEWQREAVERLQLPYELLSDSGFTFVEALRLPTFRFEGRRYIKRLTLLNRGGRIEKVFYPVFPSDRNAADVIAHLRTSED
jgi:peroxiredoxin